TFKNRISALIPWTILTQCRVPKRLANTNGMIWGRRNKEQERYYLFAGMGGEPSRRRRKVYLAWSILAGLMVSMAFAIVLFLVNR
ncbi:MAG TPA: hypothetical protein VFB72_16265, partial [Verrucomicrobiae bacterium]|nr:hypothetical protein [Verrucomicrobiae bacterium]